MVEQSAQQSTMLYAIPIMASALALASPCLSMTFLYKGKFTDAVNRLIGDVWTRPKRLTQLSMLSLLLSIFFFMSNMLKSRLALYGFFGAVLANANFFVDSFGKRRAWLVLLVWQALNLYQMMGGTFMLLQIYPAAVDILTIAANGPLGSAGTCEGSKTEWCGDAYIAVQMLISFVYLLLHVCTVAVVASRVVKEYGGKDMPEDRDEASVETGAREGLINTA